MNIEPSRDFHRLYKYSTKAAYLFGFATLLTLFEILCRYVFQQPTLWVHETVITLVALGYMAGGIYALLTQQHIRLEVLYERLSDDQKKFSELMNDVICFCLFTVIFFASVKVFWGTVYSPAGYFRLEGTGSAWNPPIPVILKASIALCLFLLACISGAGVKAQLQSIHLPRRYSLDFSLLILANVVSILGLCLSAYLENIALCSFFGICLLLSLALNALPLAFITLFCATAVALVWHGPAAMPLVTSRIYGFTTEYVLVAVPLFIFMAALLDKSAMATNLYAALRVCANGLRGGVAIQTLFAGLLLAAVSGIIGGEIVLLGLVALPQMLKMGYQKEIAIGTVCAAGALGTMIPPSIVLVVVGMTANISIGDLFLATIVPGLLLAAFYLIYILGRCHFNPSIAPEASPVNKSERLRPREFALAILGPFFIMLVVLGSIYSGIASITESAAMGVCSTIIMCGIRGCLNKNLIWESLQQVLQSCGIIIWVGIGASVLVGTYNLVGGNVYIQEWVSQFDSQPLIVILMMIFVLVFLGFFMDWIGIALLTLPIFMPIVKSLGYSQIWFGILFSVCMQISYLSPPFGPAAFYLKSVAPKGISLQDIYRSVLPFIAIQTALLALLLAYPGLATFFVNSP